jgi:hypothetical protein
MRALPLLNSILTSLLRQGDAFRVTQLEQRTSVGFRRIKITQMLVTMMMPAVRKVAQFNLI